MLATDLVAGHDQPPFPASAMDGYAVRRADVADLPATLTIMGEAAAGRGFHKPVGAGEAVRIFTGAPVPEGADAIVIQENTTRDDDRVTVTDGVPEAGHIRRRGFDFSRGDGLIKAGSVLGPRTLTLAAAMGHADVSVHRRPTIA
ncbi:MAG: molybdopterin molybdenumtransferase MoeA, partial [Cyanobacteria bacterium P01_D01_bin.50]